MRAFVKIPQIVWVIFLLFSCHISRKDDIKQIVREWQGKEVLVPAEPAYKILGRDTLCPDIWDQPYKIFTYIDSIGCTSCQLGLPQWKALIDSCYRQQINVKFIFAVHSSDYEYFGHELRFNEFNYPIIYDYHNDFDKLNRFPPAPYRTLLLDKDNRIQLIGSPVNNPAMWDLYLKIIMQSQ